MNKSQEELRRVIEEMGGTERIAEKLKQFTRDKEFVSKHWEELLRQYPDKWIAVLRGRVIAFADDLKTLIGSIPEEDRSATVVKFLNANPKPLILMAASAFRKVGTVPLNGAFS